MSRPRQTSTSSSSSGKAYLQLILFALTLIALWFFHSQAQGMERLMGLAHGQIVETNSHQFYVFDNLEQASAERLTQSLKTTEWSTRQALNAHGYGVKRILLLFALCYAAIFLASKSLVKLSLAKFKPRRPKFSRLSWRYSLVGLGAYAQFQDIPNFVPFLFTFCGVVLVLKLARANPSAKTVAKSLRMLSWVRLYWAGSVLHLLFFEKLSRHTAGSLVFALCSLSLAMIASRTSYPAEKWISYPGDKERLNQESRFSYKLGGGDFLGLFAVIYLASHFQPGLAAVVVALTPYSLGGLVYSLLLRSVVKNRPADPNMGRAASPMRIASCVWFASPLLYWELFAAGGSIGFLIWLSGLQFMALAGRPWGSSFNTKNKSLRDTLPDSKPSSRRKRHEPAALYPGVPYLAYEVSRRQAAAIIAMRLPPELSAETLKKMTPEEVQAVTLEITQLPSISPKLRDEVCSLFAYQMDGLLCDDWLKEWEESVRTRPHRAARVLRDWYLSESGAWKTDKSFPWAPRPNYPKVHTTGLTPKQKAAVLFMSLPPEMSAQLFSELGPEEVQAITLEITQLPSIAPEVRAEVIKEFLSSSHAGSPAVGLVMPVQKTSSKPAPVAGIPPLPRRLIPQRLTPVQKAALLFGSMPLKMRNQLISELGSDEVKALKYEIAQLSDLSSAHMAELVAFVKGEFLCSSSSGEKPLVASSAIRKLCEEMTNSSEQAGSEASESTP